MKTLIIEKFEAKKVGELVTVSKILGGNGKKHMWRANSSIRKPDEHTCRASKGNAICGVALEGSRVAVIRLHEAIRT